MASPLVLIVEDNPADCRLVEEAIRVVGSDCAILCLENAVQALRYLSKRAPFEKAEAPALIVVDLHMPVIDGFKFIEILKGDEEWAKIPVLVMSGRVGVEETKRAAKLGIRTVLAKPKEWGAYVEVGRRIVGELPVK